MNKLLVFFLQATTIILLLVLFPQVQTVKAEGTFAECSVDVSNPSRGQPVNLIIRTTSETKITDGFIGVSRKGSKKSSENVNIHFDDDQPKISRTIYLGSAFENGVYDIHADDNDRNGRIGSCKLSSGFNVGGGGGSGDSGGKNPCEGGNCETALGNIPTDPTGLTGRVLTIGIGLAGGIALIFMVYGSIKILTSAGDPKKVADGREIIVAAITGTLFLILSVLILRFIGGTFLPTNPFS